MKATELRIGNLVQYSDGGGITELSGIAIHSFDCGILKIKPIELTEEWLIRLGFEWDIYWQGHTDGNWVLTSGEIGWRIAYGKRKHDFIVYKIQYVHQLQNLYFALTAVELELK